MLIDALVFLAAAVVCVPIAKRLGLGAVLGYLIAGAVIGPWGLKLVEDIESTMHFSEFGVVLMLFIIGLELEPKRLMSMRRDVFGGGGIQMTLCTVALMLGALALGLDWRAALVAGFALSLSSTAIAMAVMAERNLIPTPTGRTAFAISLFQDIAAIPFLTAIPLLAVGGAASSSGGWHAAGIALAAIAGVIIIGRYIAHPVLRLIAATDLREVFTAFSLLLVIGIAQLMALAGMSMALGAFLAGVLLASSEYRHALMTDIEPFKGLLLGLFFISVGMTIDFGLIVQKPLIVFVLVAGLIVLKLGALWVAAKFIGITKRQNMLFAILLVQGSEFAFVVFTAARAEGVLTTEWAALLTIAVVLSMVSAPLLALAFDRMRAWRECQANVDGAEKKRADTIDEHDAPVIIAGFGRYGQIVGRLLFANGIRAVVLDHDPDQIDSLRRFGYKVFYGDATRLDLLTAAGAKTAKLIVNAIDDVDDNLELTDVVRKNFPALTIVARARNVRHYVELRNRGVTVIERETFESALRSGREVLEQLGVDRFRAREMADIFRRHNISTMESMIEVFTDEAKLLTAAKAGRQELENQFAKDRARFDEEHSGKDW